MENENPELLKPRKAIVAFLLSIFTPGLGQIYNGQGKKGFLFFIFLLLFFLTFRLTSCMTSFYGMVFAVIVEMSFRIFVMVDAIRNSIKQKKYVLQKINSIGTYVMIGGFMLIVIVCFLNFRTFFAVQTFVIPTSSGEPTIHVGDRVVADMRIYDSQKPGYGDIVVYTKPDGNFYPSRIVGLPNDKIELKNNILIINGKQCTATFLGEKEGPDYITGKKINIKEYEEVFPNGHKHTIYKYDIPLDSSKANFPETIVPSGHYFIVGDNRDDALDSRFIGPIKDEDIAGRILYSYWGKTNDRINIDFRDK